MQPHQETASAPVGEAVTPIRQRFAAALMSNLIAMKRRLKRENRPADPVRESAGR